MVKIGTKHREKEDFSPSLKFSISSFHAGIWDVLISPWVFQEPQSHQRFGAVGTQILWNFPGSALYPPRNALTKSACPVSHPTFPW